jgi:hypothetical protein
MRFVSLSILTRVHGTVSPAPGGLSVGSRFENGVMAWMDGLVLAGGAAGGVTDAGWLSPGGGSPALHDIGPKRAATATSVEAARRVALDFARWRPAGRGDSEHLLLMLNTGEQDCFAATAPVRKTCPFRGAVIPHLNLRSTPAEAARKSLVYPKQRARSS